MQALRDANDRVMPEATLAELRVAKAELDNNSVIHHLTEGLSRDLAKGDVGALDLSGVQTRGLSERIESAEEIGVQTTHAEQLLQAARIVRSIRLAMVSGLGCSSSGAV